MKTIVISNRKGGSAKQAVAVCEADISPVLTYEKGLEKK